MRRLVTISILLSLLIAGVSHGSQRHPVRTQMSPRVVKQVLGDPNYDQTPRLLSRTAAPTANDDTTKGIKEGTVWLDETNDKVYICQDNTIGAAIWMELAAASGGAASRVVTVSDANYSMTAAQLSYASIRMQTVSARVLTLPSVGASQDGKVATILKTGAGKLTIQASDSDTIDDSSAGGTVYNADQNVTYGCLVLEYVHAITSWCIRSSNIEWVKT